jgi:hypothetical protein
MTLIKTMACFYASHQFVIKINLVIKGLIEVLVPEFVLFCEISLLLPQFLFNLTYMGGFQYCTKYYLKIDFDLYVDQLIREYIWYIWCQTYLPMFHICADLSNFAPSRCNSVKDS